MRCLFSCTQATFITFQLRGGERRAKANHCTMKSPKRGIHSSTLNQFKVDIDQIFSGLDQVNIELPVCDIACPVCLSVTADPRLLMCGHRICMSCATRLTMVKAPGYPGTIIKCPTCSNVGSSHTVPDLRTRDAVMSQTVVCGHKGCSELCNLRDVLAHMKRCKFRVDDRSLLNGAVKRCRSEIDTLEEDTQCKKRRYRDIHKVVTTFNDEMSRKYNQVCGDKLITVQAVRRFMMGLRQAVGDDCFRRLYKEECTDYHQSLVNKVKAA